MTFTLTITCDSAAFEDDLCATLGAIIGTCAEQVEEGILANSLRDKNGNTVARFELDEPVEAMSEE